MNTRAPDGRPWRCPAPAILAAVAALVLPHASALAGCGSHDPRPSIPLGWAEASADRPDHPHRPPTCSGSKCSRTPLPPIVVPPRPQPQTDICEGLSVEAIPDRQSAARVEVSDGLDPIGRVTEIERPPCRTCRPSSAL